MIGTLTGLGIFALLAMSAIDDYIRLCQEEKRQMKRAMLRRKLHSSNHELRYY